MASVRIPAWPKGIAGNVWANALADQSLYAVESEIWSYTAAAATVAFSIPEDSIIWSIGLEVTTAFVGVVGADFLTVQDTGANGTLAKFAAPILMDTSADKFTVIPKLQRYTKNSTSAAGKVARPITISPPAATAGAFRIWLELKPNRGALNKLKSNR